MSPDGFTSGAIPQRIASLNHKVLDNAMEEQPVVVAVGKVVSIHATWMSGVKAQVFASS
jgi:hypothetical protein